jgi:hypothetical protein
MSPKANPQKNNAQPDYLTFRCPLTFEATGASDKSSGGTPTFRMVAYTGGTMRISGFPHPVVVDLEGLSIERQDIPVRLDHNARQGVGHTQRVVVENGAVIAEGLISRDTSWARDVAKSAANGFPWQASIGAAVVDAEFVPNGHRVSVNGRTFDGPLHVVRKAVLKEISFVDSGADANTSARVAAQRNPDHNTPQEQTSMSSDTSPGTDTSHTTTTDPAGSTDQPATTGNAAQGATNQAPAGDHGNSNNNTAAVTARPAAEKPGDSQTPNTTQSNHTQVAAQTTDTTGASTHNTDEDPVMQMRQRVAAESRRIEAVRKICDGKFPGVEAQAIESGWDATRTELEVLRASRPKAPMVQTRGSNDSDRNSGQVLEAACMLTAKLGDVEKLYDERTLDAASKRYRGGIGLQELLLEAAWANGYTGRNFRDPRSVLRHAFGTHGGNVEAAFSTVDVGGILSNVANKFLLGGFFSVERTWRNITAIRNVSDFKTVTSYRLIGKDQYEKVAPGGELKHGSLGEEQYSNKADTYGLLLSIDRRDIINDDLGAITTVPRKLGRGSGLKINDVFWTTFLNNAAFFTSGGKNYISGAATALSIDGLTSGETAFMDQVDSDGKPIGIMPAVLLVPTALSAVATTLWKSLEIRDTTASTKYPVANPHQGKFRVEVSRYLANNTYSGGSSKAWYLLSDPNDLPVIETAFLNGQESPTIETTEADFNVLGVQMRGYHDFGVALQDPRGGVKAKGEA